MEASRANGTKTRRSKYPILPEAGTGPKHTTESESGYEYLKHAPTPTF